MPNQEAVVVPESNAKTRRLPHETGWFKALKGVEEDYELFRVDRRV
jgi:hypothetical protein